MNTSFYTCAIASITAAGVVVRPFRLPEAIWAVGGALLILLSGILNPMEVWAGVAKGTDVYLFLIGMMLFPSLPGRKGCLTGLQPLPRPMQEDRQRGSSLLSMVSAFSSLHFCPTTPRPLFSRPRSTPHAARQKSGIRYLTS